MGTLERAVALAASAHAGQIDKAGQPYILHPLRVMMAQADPAARIAGVLHDVVEDCDVTLDDLADMGFAPEIVCAVDALTHREGETYEAYVRRAAADPIARRVKLADLRDNSDLSRIPAPTDRDLARIERYRRAMAMLDGA